MKSLKRSSSFLIALVLTTVATIALSNLISLRGYGGAFGEGQTYTMTLSAATGTLTANSSDGYKTASYGPIDTALGNPIAFAFTDGMKSTVSNTLGQLKASSGNLYNATPITGIKSITINYASGTNMMLYLGTSANPSGNSSSLATGTAANSSGAYSYFKVACGSKYSTITGIIIQYSCTVGSGGGTGTSSSSDEGSSSDTSGEVGSSQYSLVTSASQLTIGVSYLVVASNSGAYYAAGILSSAYLTSVTIPSPVSNIITLGSESVSTFVLGGTSGAYTLTSAEGQLSSSAAKNVNYSSSGSGTWAITISNPAAAIQNTTSSYGSIQYNSSSPHFTTYTSSLTAISLYKSAAEVQPVALTGVTISKSSLSLSKDSTYTLTASFSPANVYPTPTLNWATENSGIATVSNGVVTGKGEGTTNIVATATQGSTVVSSSCEVTVTLSPNYTVKTMAYDYRDYMDNNYYSNMDSMPTTGTVNLLVIPVQLAGTTMTEATRSRIQKAYFGTEAETGWHSVSSFYNEESNGRLTITGAVAPIYPTSYETTITEAQTTSLVTTATNWYKTNYSVNSGREFDADSDGYIDGVVLIYSAPNNYEGNDNLWAYCYWTAVNENVSSPVANTYFWASYDFMDESANCEIDAHTYIHETGHLMGLDDYYNYDSASTDGAAGGFNMQDFNVGEHDPYSRVALGWIDPIVPTGNTTLTIAPGQAIILSPNDLSSNSPFDEYLILDVYSPMGLNEFDATYEYGGSGSMYPKGPSTTGIRVWHVDARLMKNYPGSGIPTLTTSISPGNDYYHAMSNSTNSSYGSKYSGYRDYRLLHLLQCGGANTYAENGQFAADDIWTAGDAFSMSSYASFFVDSGKLNSGTALPYSFSVTSISGTNVTISISKN
ncbi:MAG: Ig-like domain-containing protein [Bacilli bacterium]|jgi:M6 family metalloprotease-like protein